MVTTQKLVGNSAGAKGRTGIGHEGSRSASAFTTQRESPLDTEGRNLSKLQVNSHLAKLQISHKEVEGTS